MGTRSLISGPQSKSAPDRRMGFAHLEVKKEFRIKKEAPDDEIKEYAETAMNELLGWYGYDKVDSRDTQGLDLHHFATGRPAAARRSPSDAESSDAEGPKSVPGTKDGPSRGSPSLPEQGATPSGCIICSWCNKVVSHKMFSLKTPGGEKSFCSEMCFSQCRRANFKRNKTCDWCRHIRHTVNYVDFQDGEHQLQFCSDKCLNQYKMNIFCKETEAHLQLHPHLQGLGSGGGSGGGAGSGGASPSVRLITPDLWLRDCRSESPASDRSASPTDAASSPIRVKPVSRTSDEVPRVPPKPVPSSETPKTDKREKTRKTDSVGKSKRHSRWSSSGGERRGSSSSPRGAETPTPPKAPFPPPLLPLGPHPSIPPPDLRGPAPLPLRPPPFVPLLPGSFAPSPVFPPDHPLRRNPPLRYDHLLRTSSPTAPAPAPAPMNPPARPQPPPPPRSLLPPVTVLVPYPVALAIPIPLPIPIPIPLGAPRKTPDPQTPPRTAPDPPPPSAPEDSSPPRPLRKRKRVPEVPQDEDDLPKRKTVPV